MRVLFGCGHGCILFRRKNEAKEDSAHSRVATFDSSQLLSTAVRIILSDPDVAHRRSAYLSCHHPDSATHSFRAILGGQRETKGSAASCDIW